MKHTRFELFQDGRAVASVVGYAVGNFFVYRAHYWHIAHLHTHVRLLGDYARRKDALAVVEAADSELWQFDIVAEQLDNIHSAWVRARNVCVKVDGILRLPKKDVPDTSQ